MDSNRKAYRRILFASAGLLATVAVVLVAGVIPPVKSDTFSLAAPESAATAFWVNVAFNVLAAAAFALRATGRSRLSRGFLVSLALLTLLFALALTDAAFAFRAHGQAMHTVPILLLFCASADLLAAVLADTAVFVIPRGA
jgi:hypothetical protein